MKWDLLESQESEDYVVSLEEDASMDESQEIRARGLGSRIFPK